MLPLQVQPMAPLRVRLHPSRQLGLLLCVGHVGAAVLSWVAPIPWWLSLVLSSAALASLAFGLRSHAWRSASEAVVGFELRPDGSGAIEDRSGRWREVGVLGSSFVSPLLTVLNLRVAGAGRRRSLIVTPDALGPDEFRRLRVWLRWRGAPAAPSNVDNPAGSDDQGRRQ
jgi:toxin CptA